GDDPHPRPPAGGGTRRQARAPGARRAPAGSAHCRVEGGGRARARRDVRSLRARPAAGRRRGRRGELGRGQKLTKSPAATPSREVDDSGLYWAVVLATKDLMQAEPGVWVEGPDGELVPDYESTFPEINEGEVVHGKVVRVDKDEVLVDIGYKSEGVIPVAELSIRRSVNPADEVSLGDEVDALVLTKE